MRNSALVVVFARAPVAGRVKTRLIPALGAWRAWALHVRLVRAALRTAHAADCGPVELHGTARHGLFPDVKFRLQRGADLGERMHRAIARGLRRHRAVILIGTDCPALRPGDLRAAARLLRGGNDAVLAPAEDGGYVLIAMRRVSPRAFSSIAWGSDQVCAETARRFAALGYRWRLLRTLWDVDRPGDLARLTPRKACDPKSACYTRFPSREEVNE